MEVKVIEVNGEYFQIHYEMYRPVWDKSNEHTKDWTGKVYCLVGEEPNLFYHEDSSEMTTDINEARLWMEFNYCWRGVWEGRVYPKQEEYWGEDMSVIADLWSKIEAFMKERIKADHPDYKYFD